MVLGDGNTAKETITFSDPTGVAHANAAAAEFACTVPVGVHAERGSDKGGLNLWVRAQEHPDATRLGGLGASFWKAYMRDGLANLKMMAEVA